jgi:hypothetical protein
VTKNGSRPCLGIIEDTFENVNTRIDLNHPKIKNMVKIMLKWARIMITACLKLC